MSQPVSLPQSSTAERSAGDRRCIHQKFAEQAVKTPAAIALSCGEARMTYGELNARANRLARHLQSLGVGPEVPVALYLERSLEMVVAILAVLKAGGAYVPIDLAYPPDRFMFMLEDSRAPVLLTQASLRAKLPPCSATVLALDADWTLIEAQSPETPKSAVTPDNIAYIIYTSGSTGKPKGVLVTHHNVVRLLEQTAPWYRFDSNDVWPLFHSYAFDVSVWELWGSLFNGGRLVIVPYLVTRSPADFYNLLAREGVTVLNQTPSAFRQLIWAEETAQTKHPLQLRYVICAGEALELQSLKPWFDRHGDQKPKTVNMYGITETTVHSTFRIIRKEDLTNGMGSVIGVPIPDLEIHLVDEKLRPVPKGTPGEICVGGAGVARGYLNRDELTRQRFIPDPFSSSPAARLYRSGDLAQINANGEMEYLGRMDHQVKIRGFRVELGEIESALNRHPAIRESVVIAQDSASGDKRLIAYAVPVQTSPSITELREHLSKSIPDYMIPALFMFLEALPLTTNGKVDRRALPSPDGARPELRTSYAAPEGLIETKLAEIWAEVLEIDKVGRHDNFFELGGDSIRSITILSRAQQNGWHLSLEQVFAHPTVAGLAQCAESAAARGPSRETKPFELISAEDRALLPGDVEDAYPIGKLQLGMFYYNELDPLSAMYHDVFSYRIQARFDESKLRQAIQRLTERHPLMRTSFHLAGFSQPLQLVHAQAEVPLMIEDLRSLSNAEQDEKLVEWVEGEKRRPFNRSQAPLFRFHVQIQNERCFHTVLSFHHSCLDGWSLAAVMTELFQEYSALIEGKEQKIVPPQVTYRDFIALEQQAIASEASALFWKDRLAEASPQTLPRWPKSMCRGGHEQKRGPEVQIPEQVLSGLKKVAQSAGAPLKTVLLAAHQRVMAALYGQTDVVSGLIVNGRPEQTDGEKLVGLFLNTVPLRQKLAGDTWNELVKDTFAAEQQLMPHRRMPLAEIQRLNGGHSLFESAFDFVHFHVYRNLQNVRDLDLSEGHYFEANNLTTYTTFMLDVTSTKLEIHIDYDPNSICREQVEEFTQYYVNTLSAIATSPDSRYETFCPLTGPEKTRILCEWNNTAADYPAEQEIHKLFERRVAESPETIAVVCGPEQVTYRELNERAERFAERLRRMGVGPGMLVGICVERSIEMMTALLGILKSGAAYLPLDPTYPSERLAFMLEDSKAPVVVTDPSVWHLVPQTGAKVISIDGPPKNEDAEVSAECGTPAGLAYVIYTSGSTGRPKGVQVTHRSVINLLLSAARTAGITQRDTLLAVTTLSFDIAGLELFMPLVLGGTVVIATRDIAGDGIRLAERIESSRATVMQGTPATWRLLIESGWAGKMDLKIFCGGEALQRALADQLLARAQEVWNFYGPTETTIWSSAWKVLPENSILIGRPLANTRMYILDAHSQPAPVGTIGELHIGGDGVAFGYLNRADLTAERFVADPFSQSGGRMYKTGDLARRLPDGNIECLGRIDHQVKIRGFRIELGEVETALRRHTGIAQAVVAARDAAPGEKRLVGYIISKNGPIAVSELRDFLKAQLPLYMVPAHFVMLGRFPLTPNGKIDLRALPSPDEAQTVRRTEYRAPRTNDEQTLAGFWREVLLLQQVGLDDNFFELGGDSLSATRVFARINRTFGTELTLREILDHPTIGELAELISHPKGATRAKSSIIPRQPRAVQIVT